jgi:hypothetical protein
MRTYIERNRIEIECDTIAEVKPAVKHLEALGMELIGLEMNGCWRCDDGEDAWPFHHSLALAEIGRQWVKTEFDGEETKCRPYENPKRAGFPGGYIHITATVGR